MSTPSADDSGSASTGVGVSGGGSPPDSPAGRLHALFEGHRLTPTQRRIAHSMVRRAADVPFLSSVELAELAGVSQPSVTRFAVALGFDGYPALRKHLREVAPAQQSAGQGSYNEYQQAVEAEIENLRHLAEVLADPRPVQRAGRCSPRPGPSPSSGCAPPPPRRTASRTSPPRSTRTYGCCTRAAR